MREAVERRGGVYRYTILKQHVSFDESSADQQKTRVLEIEILHLCDMQPFAYESRMINLAELPEAEEVDFGEASPGTWLMENVNWTRANHRVMAQSAGSNVASILDIQPGEACLVVERKMWRGAGWLSRVRQFYPGTRYQLEEYFSPTGVVEPEPFGPPA